ncbi:isochorismatase family protein [Desulfolutivibrio sulfoxidireducens]|nr:isochorismatase family protein [Desulfolutivibrio sulfoxidireducens]
MKKTLRANAQHEQVLNERIVPLVALAGSKGFPIIMLTNDPKVISSSTRTSQELADLLETYHAETIYHGQMTREGFSEHLRALHIENLVYTGFASNVCVIGREPGMIPMRNRGLNLLFIPEASAACEFGESWETRGILNTPPGSSPRASPGFSPTRPLSPRSRARNEAGAFP